MSFQSQEDMEPYLHDGICPTRRRDWTSLEEAMERENQAKQQGSRQASTERYKPVEYMSQLALKRGAKMRGDTRGLDYKSGAVTAVLLSHNPDFRYFYNNDAEELADHLHWFDELAGCAPRLSASSEPLHCIPLQLWFLIQAIGDGIAARP